MFLEDLLARVVIATCPHIVEAVKEERRDMERGWKGGGAC